MSLFPDGPRLLHQFEEDDRRRRDGDTNPTERRIPTAAQYEAHQRQADLLPLKTKGNSGLYRRVWLKAFY